MTKQLIYSTKFKRMFRELIKRDPSMRVEVLDALAEFQNDPSSPILRAHILRDTMKGYNAFSVNSDVRVVYQEFRGSILLVAVGTHDMVYA